MPFPPRRLSTAAQRATLGAITAVSRRRIERRDLPLPTIGVPAHLTAVVRVSDVVVPSLDVAARHHVYPSPAIHVTVANLDDATVDVADAIHDLTTVTLPAPVLEVDALGCSPDTLFLRCLHDHRFVALRRAIRHAFGVGRSTLGVSRIFERVSFANVVRFDGPGEWIDTEVTKQAIACEELEIVRTDRLLSDTGTVVEARLKLGGSGSVTPGGGSGG